MAEIRPGHVTLRRAVDMARAARKAGRPRPTFPRAAMRQLDKTDAGWRPKVDRAYDYDGGTKK